MTRYQALRSMSCDPITAGMVAFMNWVCGVPQGKIGFMHIIIDYDPDDVYDPSKRYYFDRN